VELSEYSNNAFFSVAFWTVLGRGHQFLLADLILKTSKFDKHVCGRKQRDVLGEQSCRGSDQGHTRWRVLQKQLEYKR
jgi:hypothetical protein